MRWIDLRTGYTCNQRCRFCDQGDKRARLADAPLDALGNVLRAAWARPGPKPAGVWLAGGEVTIRRDLPALVALAREVGFPRVGLQTNGRVLATPGAAARLRAAGLTDTTIALHGPTAALHEWLTREPGSYAQALGGARRTVEAGGALHVATVIVRSTTEELPALAALAIRLGARTHRWIPCRPQGAAEAEDRALVPRFAALVPRLAGRAGPLGRALELERSAAVEAEVVGFPLCVLGPWRAAAAGGAERHFPPGLEESPPPTVFGAVCAGCSMRPRCPGLPEAYAARWGFGELAPEPPPPPGDRLYFAVSAPCRFRCEGCAPRDHLGDAWSPEGLRALRQRLVAAAAEPSRALVFAGASPWSHPALPGLVRDAVRLGFARVVVRGPVHPLVDAPDELAEKLAGLEAVEVPELDDASTRTQGAGDAEQRGLAWIRRLLPGCTVHRYAPGPTPPGPLEHLPWAGCQGADGAQSAMSSSG